MSIIRGIKRGDEPFVIQMMREFYSSPAVYTNGSDEIFENDINTCIIGSPYLEGYVLENKDVIQGYFMVAKSFSTEFGKPCIWIEDLYIKEEYRGLGLGKMAMDFIADRFKDCVLRLEVEEENQTALWLYKKSGFTILPYMEMKK